MEIAEQHVHFITPYGEAKEPEKKTAETSPDQTLMLMLPKKDGNKVTLCLISAKPSTMC